MMREKKKKIYISVLSYTDTKTHRDILHNELLSRLKETDCWTSVQRTNKKGFKKKFHIKRNILAIAKVTLPFLLKPGER